VEGVGASVHGDGPMGYLLSMNARLH